MRWLVCALSVVLVLSACTDSSPDVTSVARDGAPARPDTVFVSDGVTIELYGPGNRVAEERSAALSSSGGVQRALEDLDGRGIERDESGGIFVRAVDEDGRELETTWIPATDPSRPDDLTGVAHFRMENDEFVVLCAGRNPAPEILTIDGKDAGPQRAFPFGGCYEFARALFMSCVELCGQHGIPDRTCRTSCQSAGISALTSCVLMSAVD
jgi:hypothetical protein